MYQSFQKSRPITLEKIDTIADSLAPPMAEPYTYSICRRYVDEIVLVDDDQLKSAMRHLFHELKLAVEPAGAATTAGLLESLKDKVKNKKVGIIVCGSNIEPDNFHDLIS